MILLAQEIDRQFQKDYIQRHVFANELTAKTQRFKECFAGNTLPKPTPAVIAAWVDLPNMMTEDVPPMFAETGTVPPAPPPTPTMLLFEMSEDPSNEPSCNGGQEDDWVAFGNINRLAPDVAVSRVVANSTTDDTISRGNCPQPSSDQRGQEDTSSQSTNSPLLSSGSESPSSPTVPVGFHNMVNQWLSDYRSRGAAPFIKSLIAFGAMSPGCGRLASDIARVVLKKVARTSYTQGNDLAIAFRAKALAEFKKYWEQGNTCTETPSNTSSRTTYSINIAAFMGSLFNARVFVAKDLYLCLDLLSGGEKYFDRLCAMHALVVQANDKLCKARNLKALLQFKDSITLKDAESGEYLWAKTTRSRAILTDILATIE